MMTRNILAYAKACNVDPYDMAHSIRNDSFAREQFEAWKKENVQ